MMNVLAPTSGDTVQTQGKRIVRLVDVIGSSGWGLDSVLVELGR
jgi:hypothetical protein